MPEGPNVVVPDGRRCQLYYFTGKVLSTRKQKETQISSGSQYNAGTNQTVTSVSSRTVDHHEFFLSDGNGQERSFRTVDFDFPCREGQTLSVMWTIEQGKNEGPYLAVRNHNTNERFNASVKSVAAWLRKKWTIKLIAIWLGATVVLSFVSGGLAFLWFVGALIYGLWKNYSDAKKAANELLNGSGLQQLDAQLAPLKPLPA